MFNYINGTVAELEPNLAILDCGGVGFELNTTAYTIGSLKIGEQAKLYTYLHVREDIFQLFGFSSKSEKRCFEMLIGVSGVGPKAALSILSTSSPEQLIMSIISEDDKALTAAPGVGKKIAQRIVLELKDKMAKETNELSFRNNPQVNPAAYHSDGKLSDAAAALTVLGYSAAEVSAVLKNMDISDLGLEDIIKAALKQMVK